MQRGICENRFVAASNFTPLFSQLDWVCSFRLFLVVWKKGWKGWDKKANKLEWTEAVISKARKLPSWCELLLFLPRSKEDVRSEGFWTTYKKRKHKFYFQYIYVFKQVPCKWLEFHNSEYLYLSCVIIIFLQKNELHSPQNSPLESDSK